MGVLCVHRSPNCAIERSMEVRMADTDLDFDAPSDEALDAEAEADFAAGRVIPHERMREWL